LFLIDYLRQVKLQQMFKRVITVFFLFVAIAANAQFSRSYVPSVRTPQMMLNDEWGGVPVLQRLLEVNAYGADELISLFKYYKMDAFPADATERRDETPLFRAYAEWCDSLEDALYLLRKVGSRETAELLLPGLQGALSKVERRADAVEKMQSGLSPQQVASERVPTERLRRVSDDLRVEIRRLRDAGSYGYSALNAVLENCSRLIRG
jgi:hypothetical protein